MSVREDEDIMVWIWGFVCFVGGFCMSNFRRLETLFQQASSTVLLPCAEVFKNP